METRIIKESSRGYDLIPIEDELFSRREIYLTEEVNAMSSADLIKEFHYLDQASSGEEITFFISSPGGEVLSGLAVYDCILSLASPVNTVCIGQAASMGSILFLAGRRRIMYPHTKIMIHDPSFGGGDIGGQKPGELQEKVDDLKRTQEIIAGIIAERSGLTLKQVCVRTKKDTWLSAKEAKRLGIATEIIDLQKAG